MLERLATLAIEAKDRLTALEKRMAQLEQKVKPE
jgi:BMFP domain-containing protein YqiC